MEGPAVEISLPAEVRRSFRPLAFSPDGRAVYGQESLPTPPSTSPLVGVELKPPRLSGSARRRELQPHHAPHRLWGGQAFRGRLAGFRGQVRMRKLWGRPEPWFGSGVEVRACAVTILRRRSDLSWRQVCDNAFRDGDRTTRILATLSPSRGVTGHGGLPGLPTEAASWSLDLSGPAYLRHGTKVLSWLRSTAKSRRTSPAAIAASRPVVSLAGSSIRALTPSAASA